MTVGGNVSLLVLYIFLVSTTKCIAQFHTWILFIICAAVGQNGVIHHAVGRLNTFHVIAFIWRPTQHGPGESRFVISGDNVSLYWESVNGPPMIYGISSASVLVILQSYWRILLWMAMEGILDILPIHAVSPGNGEGPLVILMWENARGGKVLQDGTFPTVWPEKTLLVMSTQCGDQTHTETGCSLIFPLAHSNKLFLIT